ncbi:hypothetical protein BRSPCE3_62670 [Bradyrhizobium sp. Ce-3]|nr:hypothetical protein BRSPCE3_62670 [Bradyrhizobium sp. Ce-3]
MGDVPLVRRSPNHRFVHFGVSHPVKNDLCHQALGAGQKIQTNHAGRSASHVACNLIAKETCFLCRRWAAGNRERCRPCIFLAECAAERPRLDRRDKFQRHDHLRRHRYVGVRLDRACAVENVSRERVTFPLVDLGSDAQQQAFTRGREWIGVRGHTLSRRIGPTAVKQGQNGHEESHRGSIHTAPKLPVGYIRRRSTESCKIRVMVRHA